MDGQEMILLVTGPRSIKDESWFRQQFEKYLDRYREIGIIKIINGGAVGIDQISTKIAVEYGFEVEEHKPDYDRYDGQIAPLIRNTEMARICDFVLAIWDHKSRGTWHTIQQGVRFKKPVRMIDYPDGKSKVITTRKKRSQSF